MNIFKDKSQMPPDDGARRRSAMEFAAPKPDVVRAPQTDGEAGMLRRAAYNYDWMDVDNIPVRHRGHHY